MRHGGGGATAVDYAPVTEATSVVVAAIHRMFATSAPDARPAHRHYPKHYGFLENSCLAREMDRL